MKGNNSIIANAATVIEAMQEYLDKRAAGGVADEVEAVNFTGSEFHFSISEAKQSNIGAK